MHSLAGRLNFHFRRNGVERNRLNMQQILYREILWQRECVLIGVFTIKGMIILMFIYWLPCVRLRKNHTWGNKEIKDWAFVRDETGNIVIDETHPNWWQDKKTSERHGIRIPVLDADGNQKLDSRNRKQWKREVTDATGWNNPKTVSCGEVSGQRNVICI